jgi:hypothetical protein
MHKTLAKSRSHASLLGAASRFARQYPQVLAIVPSHLAGEQFSHQLSNSAGIHRLTLHQLAANLARPALATLGKAPLSVLGMEAVAAHAVHQALAAKSLHYFEPVADLPHFASALARTLTDLRLAQVGPGELKSTGDRKAGGPAGSDLAALLNLYDLELADRGLADLAEVLHLAQAAVEACSADSAQAAAQRLWAERWLGLPVLLLDPAVESRRHHELLRALIQNAPDYCIARSDLETSDGSPDKPTRKSRLSRLEPVDAQSLELDRSPATGVVSVGELPPLDHLRQFLFAAAPPACQSHQNGESQAFQIFSAPGEGLEAVEIARRILQHAGEGTPLDRMAIFLRSTERYQPLIEDALRRARIPAYFTRGTTRPDPAGRAFLALLACAAERCSASRFSEYLSLAQIPLKEAPVAAKSEKQSSAKKQTAAKAEMKAPVPVQMDLWVGPADDLLGAADEALPEAEPSPQPNPVRAPAQWEQLLVDAAVIGGAERWQRRLAGLQHEFELRLTLLEREEENARKHLQRRIENLGALQEFALPLIEQLAALPSAGTWEEWLQHLRALAQQALRHPEGVLSVLAELEPMGDIGPVGLQEVAGVLDERLRFLRQEPARRRYGQVYIGAVEEARAQQFDVVFLPGLAEGLFPQRAFEDPLLLDEFRGSIAGDLATRDDRVEEERTRLRLAVGAAQQRLVASFPRMDSAEGRPRVPSFYALELPRALEGKLPDMKEFEQRCRQAAPSRLNWPAPPTLESAIDDAEYDLAILSEQNPAAKYLVDVSPTLARSLRGRWRRWAPNWYAADGLITKDPDALAALAKAGLNAKAWSASSLQRFATCPYQFALNGVFGLKPREEAEALERMDPLTRGSLFHEVQFELLRQLKDAQRLPVDEENVKWALAECDRVLEKVAAKYEDKLAPAIPRVWRSEIEDLRLDLRGWLRHIAVHDADWLPIHFEFGFGLKEKTGRDAKSVAEPLTLAEGVRLHGSIDMIEQRIGTSPTVLRVTDHKTGQLPDVIPLSVGGGKLLQPLLYALAAEQVLQQTAESGRLFYATQKGGYAPVTIPLTPRARLVLARMLSHIDAAILNGFLPPAPSKEVCQNCDFRIVCGPYEEERFAEWKNTQDERLDGLIEIRGMI